jgi:hypothetical protein
MKYLYFVYLLLDLRILSVSRHISQTSSFIAVIYALALI